MKLLTVIFSAFLTQVLFAHDLPIKVSDELDSNKKIVLERVLSEVAELLPLKLKAGLPKNMELTIEKLTEHSVIPVNVCAAKAEKIDKNKKIVRPFVYGEYNRFKNRMILNVPVFNELAVGRERSQKINCQHRTIYDQAIATIIHELTHAYDFNNNSISNQIEFIHRAGFKKGLLRTKTKNKEAMRSVDPYELTNIAEAYAVNMEYFTMDPEFACRKPSMFDFYKKSMGVDPFPTRNCSLNNMVMMSTASGYYPISLDSKRVYRIDYLLASPGKDISSGFGHSMFRIIVCAPERMDPISQKIIPATPFGPKCLEDRLYHMVVSYRANVEDATLNYLKGMFGGYPSMLFILNFADVLDEYNRDELRDVVSYPLALSPLEKEDFVKKVIEEHWNYRGSYKFFTNNCAGESFDLLKAALSRPDLDQFSPIKPVSVLKDLDQIELISLKSGGEENFPAHTEQLMKAYEVGYSYRLVNEKKDKKSLINFIDNSLISDRQSLFNDFSLTKVDSEDLHTEISLLKSRLIMASSFSVMEQQILRSKASVFRKKAADFFMNSKDEKVKKLLQESNSALKQDFTELSNVGYGVPLFDEMVSLKDIETKADHSKDILNTLQTVLKDIMPQDISTLENISKNITLFNQKSLAIRKEYREKLELYIHQVLVNLSHEETTRALLIDSLKSNESLSKVRDLLDRDLVSTKELLDVKLRKQIGEILEN